MVVPAPRFYLKSPVDVGKGIIIMPILQMRNLRFRENYGIFPESEILTLTFLLPKKDSTTSKKRDGKGGVLISLDPGPGVMLSKALETWQYQTPSAGCHRPSLGMSAERERFQVWRRPCPLLLPLTAHLEMPT